jgi:hypothetical protein
VKSQAVLTDEGGKFRFENLAQGQGVIIAHKPGYTDNRFGDSTTLMIGDSTSPVVLKLDPESAITLKVTGEDGDAVEGLPVRVLSSEVQQGRRYWHAQQGGETDEQGEFMAGNLRPGKYYVSVGPSSRPVGHMGDGAQGSDVGYPRVFYPNARELEGAAGVEAKAGRRARLEIALSTTVPLYRISGVVVSGTPGQPCYPRLTDSSDEDIAVGVRTNPVTGMFRSGAVPAGFYTLAANCIADGQISLTGRMPVHVDSNIANVTLSVAPLATIPVDFRTNGGADADESNPTGRVILTQKQRHGRRGTAWSELEADGDDKRMVVKGAEPGIYSVDIRPNSGWYVESALYGSVDLLADDMTVPEGGGTEAIEITLRNDGASVGGNVRGRGTAAAGGMVLLVSSRAPRLVGVARIMNGSFNIRDLAPGSYRAIAIDQADDLEYTNPEELRDYLTKAQDVTLGPKQDGHLDLELVQREK